MPWRGRPNQRLKLAARAGNEQLGWLAGEASDDQLRALQLTTRITSRELPEIPSPSFATPCYRRYRDAMDSVA